MSFRVEIKWTPRSVKRQLENSPEIVQEELQDGLTVLREDTTREAQKRAPKDRGTLGQSLYPGATQTLTRTTKNQAIVGSRLVQAAPQEYGTRPFWPPAQPLEEWAERKGMDKSAAYFIRRKIAREGIEPKHYLRDGLAEAMKGAKKVMERHANRILERIGLK